jgi:predicted  nucleic acid-binding Zn-ribbon protein
MKTSRPYPNESEDLELHVTICAERYQQLDRRLEGLENDVSEIKTNIQSYNSSVKTAMITTLGTVVVGILSIIGAVLVKL